MHTKIGHVHMQEHIIYDTLSAVVIHEGNASLVYMSPPIDTVRALHIHMNISLFYACVTVYYFSHSMFIVCTLNSLLSAPPI